MLPGETILGGGSNPEDLPLRVMRSNAGYYIGTQSKDGTPYSRETEYFKSLAEVQDALDYYQRTGILMKQRR